MSFICLEPLCIAVDLIVQFFDGILHTDFVRIAYRQTVDDFRYCYADQGDGLFSFFDLERKEGLYVQIKKQGKIQVGFGSGWGLFTFQSINANAVKKAFNIITVVFRQVEGWCDLYVNGILSSRKQFPRHMRLKWPQRDAYLGKYVDHTDYKENAKAGCFYGFMKGVLSSEAKLYLSCYYISSMRRQQVLT